VSVPFLSSQWAEALKKVLNGDPAFHGAAAGKKATLQQIITQNGDATRYWIVIADGVIDMGIGDAAAPDATITQSYDSAVAMARRELSPVTAFMMGKVKVDGNMGLLLGLQAVLVQLPEAMAKIDVDY
jgi:putative sterol carrier protein